MPDNLNAAIVPSGAYEEPEDIGLLPSFDQPPAVPPGLMALSEYTGGQHTLYWIRHSYRYVSGKKPMPVAAETGDCRFPQLHAPTMIHRVVWACKRVGSLPICLSPDAPDDNHTLIEAQIDVMSPTVTEDLTTKEYTVSGEYVYGMATPVWVDVGLSMGVMPWTTMKLEDEVLSPGSFVTGLF